MKLLVRPNKTDIFINIFYVVISEKSEGAMARLASLHTQALVFTVLFTALLCYEFVVEKIFSMSKIEHC